MHESGEKPSGVWQNITNFVDGRVLDLFDPFVAEEVWTNSGIPEPVLGAGRARVLAYMERLRRGV